MLPLHDRTVGYHEQQLKLADDTSWLGGPRVLRPEDDKVFLKNSAWKK